MVHVTTGDLRFEGTGPAATPCRQHPDRSNHENSKLEVADSASSAPTRQRIGLWRRNHPCQEDRLAHENRILSRPFTERRDRCPRIRPPRRHTETLRSTVRSGSSGGQPRAVARVNRPAALHEDGAHMGAAALRCAGMLHDIASHLPEKQGLRATNRPRSAGMDASIAGRHPALAPKIARPAGHSLHTRPDSHPRPCLRPWFLILANDARPRDHLRAVGCTILRPSTGLLTKEVPMASA